MKNLVLIFLIFIIVPDQNVINDNHPRPKIRVGSVLSNIQLKDTKNRSLKIPDIRTKVAIIFYTDPDCKNINDPLSKAIKEAGFGDRISGIGIANCADTWIPDALIRKGALKKEKQFPGSLLLLDSNKHLAGEWGLGDCDDLSLVIVIGLDQKVKYIKYVKSESESVNSTHEVIETIRKEIDSYK
jgi:predicted transcriptional regulator